jgi:bacterioferritin-associated ferredoxin
MYVCLCKAITESDVRQAGRSGATTAAALIGALGLDSDECCGLCILDMDRFVALAAQPDAPVNVSAQPFADGNGNRHSWTAAL